MPNVKTTISLEAPLFEKAESLAQEMKISRSRLIALALEDFVQRYQNERLLEQLDAAYADGLDAEEQAVLSGMRRHFPRAADEAW